MNENKTATILNVSASSLKPGVRDQVFLNMPLDMAIQQAQELLAETNAYGDFTYQSVHVGSKASGVNLIVSRPDLLCCWNESNQQ